MRIAREYSVVRKTDHHRDSPRICPEQPIKRGLLVLPKPGVACHATIEVRLRRKGGHEVVRAPYEWNPDLESVVSAAHDRGQSLPVILGDDSSIGCVGVTPDLVVPVVVPGIPLVMLGGVCPHPWSDGLACRVLQCIAEITAVVCERIELRRGELHVIGPVVFLVIVGSVAGRSLANAGGFLPDGVSRQSLPTQLGGEGRIALPINRCRERKRRCVLACGRCETVR